MTTFFRRKDQGELSPEKEKRSAAKSSVVSALGLVTMKVVVGFSTGSLGILAEAAHSGLDLVAAAVTYFAVKEASKPADREHRYGHGKVENLSALFETLLLLLTCVWIGYESIHRLMSGKVEVTVTIWSFIVMGISIVVDISRSRMLHRVARKHNSQALEADALHFSTDIWSSAVVILGLGCVALSDIIPNSNFLHYADAVAALLVAGIVVHVSWQLGVRTIAALLDAAPSGLYDKVIVAAITVPGVINCHRVRIRSSGAQVFIDMHVLMDGNLSFREAHALTKAVEKVIRVVEPGADVTVHPEPK
ncbi:MAG: cation transporter [Candidatus Omnitrophica bacterium]|nr:cation transporter [Candidatus Omnitrophota bacterium]